MLRVPKDDVGLAFRSWICADGEVDECCQFWGRPSCGLDECLAGFSEGCLRALGGFCLLTWFLVNA